MLLRETGRRIGEFLGLHVEHLRLHPDDGHLRVGGQGAGIVSRSDQATRPLSKVILSARLPNGRALASVRLDGKPLESWSGETVVVPRPVRGRVYRLEMRAKGL